MSTLLIFEDLLAFPHAQIFSALQRTRTTHHRITTVLALHLIRRCPFDVVADFPPQNNSPALELREFATLEEYSAVTGQDRNSVLVGYDIFVNVLALDVRNVDALQNIYNADALDFRLRPEATAVDRGMVLPSVTNGFTGSAPDLGALEVGGTLLHYGPRP